MSSGIEELNLNPRCTRCDHYLDEHEIEPPHGCRSVDDDPYSHVDRCPCASFSMEPKQ